MSQKGQVLVISVFIYLIALGTVIALSTRYFKSLHNFTSSDNSNKAYYAAESLIENLLIKSDQALYDYVTKNSCGQNCMLNFDDGTQAFAEIKLLGNNTDTYSFEVKKDSVSEVNMDSYNKPIDVCWDGKSALTAELVYLNTAGEYKVDNYAYNPVSSTYPSEFTTAAPKYSYQNCFTIQNSNTYVLLRIKSLYEGTTVNIVPIPGSPLPLQGFLINSSGKFLDTTRKVSVIKKVATVPDIFDYSVYQNSASSTLSK